MVSYVMLCYVMLGYARLCYAILRHSILMLCYARSGLVVLDCNWGRAGVILRIPKDVH